MRNVVFLLVVAASLLTIDDRSWAQDCNMEGEYIITNLDGTHPYADMGVVIHVAVIDLGEGLYLTQSWFAQVGQDPIYSTPGLLYMSCEDGGTLVSGSRGYQGTLTYDPETGGYIADYSSAGGNTRLWNPQ